MERVYSCNPGARMGCRPVKQSIIVVGVMVVVAVVVVVAMV